MARIRTIKPDFWDSADTASASLRVRLLYIAMWNWADDYGIGDGHPGRIITFAFPNDDIPAADYPRLLADVSRAFGAVFFEHCGRPYYAIPAWDRHQRTEKKAKPKDGLIEAAAQALEDAKHARHSDMADSPTNVADVPTQSDESSGPGSRKGNRGTGDKEPPYPPNDEPSPINLPANKTGAEKARSRFLAIPSDGSQLARQIAHAYNNSLPVPLEAGVLNEVGSQIDRCIRSNIPPEAIAAGIEDWTRSDSWSPSQIPKFVHKAANRNRPTSGAGKATEKALGYQDAAERLIQALEVS